MNDSVTLLARLAAIEYMIANLYTHFCEKHDIPASMIKTQNDELRQRLAQLSGPPALIRLILL